jgi:signal transduction histidine kinase
MRPELTGRVAARAVTWPLVPVLMLPARPSAFMASDVAYVVAVVACWVVGMFLTWRAFQQGAGWAFLGLGTAFAWSAFTDEAHASALLTTFSDSSFAWWFMFLALALQSTPTLRPTSRWTSRLLPATLGSAIVFQAAALLRSTPTEGPDGVVSPWAVTSLAAPLAATAFVAILVLGSSLLASVWVLVVAFRRSRGEDRQQLLWLVAGAVPLAPCLIASFACSIAGYDTAAGWVLIPCVATLALGAALSVLRYRLYDVERVVGDSAAYALASGAVIAVFGLVVVVTTRSIPMVRPSAQWLTILATLAAAGVARPAYVWARSAVDRRFNRRRFDAVQVVRTGLAAPLPDLGAVMATATGDPTLRILFPADQDTWVTADGLPAVPGDHAVDVVRREAVAARIDYDPASSQRSVVAAVAAEAATEIDNLGLRAELARQMEQIRESRKRLAGAHLEERHRIERDLHDGAQQRILAIALQLQSARVNGADTVLRDEVDRAIAHLGLTVQELRDLAAGLQPAALAGGGLRAAVEDLRSRMPVRIVLRVEDQRFPPGVEGAAWFVIAEAVANAVKHARVDEVAVNVSIQGPGAARHLSVTVTDQGVGGADPRGGGLQGLADRVSALGGTLSVAANDPRGTRVEAALPCE